MPTEWAAKPSESLLGCSYDAVIQYLDQTIDQLKQGYHVHEALEELAETAAGSGDVATELDPADIVLVDVASAVDETTTATTGETSGQSETKKKRRRRRHKN